MGPNCSQKIKCHFKQAEDYYAAFNADPNSSVTRYNNANAYAANLQYNIYYANYAILNGGP